MNTFLRLSSATCMVAVLASGCSNHEHHQKNRTIEVIGSAEKEITPDEVYYSLTLTEYMKGKTKVTMPEMEAQLMKKAEGLGIKKQDVQVENSYLYSYDYWYWDYWYHRRHTTYFANKTFIIKLTQPEVLEKLLGGQDSLNCTSAQMYKTDNTKVTDYRDSVKVMALQAASKKAKMLLSSVGEELGPVISITEVEPKQQINPYYNYYGVNGSVISNAIMDESKAGSNLSSGNTASYKDMKLRYEMKVVYEIK